MRCIKNTIIEVLWELNASTKVLIFLQIVNHKAILTWDNLQKKLEGLNMCILCGQSEETIDHIFIVCTHANMVWEVLNDMSRSNKPKYAIKELWEDMNKYQNNNDVYKVMACSYIWQI